VTLRRSAAQWAIGGLVVPLVVLLVTELQGGVFAWPRVALILWPSSLMMMGIEGQKGGIFRPLVFLVAVGINVALYSVVGALVGVLSKRLR
jgi:hypothetical protein